jgi:hypothetical protein
MRRDRPSVNEVTADPASVPVEIHAPRGLPHAKLDEIRTRLASLADGTDAAIDADAAVRNEPHVIDADLLGLLHPPGSSTFAGENEIVAPAPSRGKVLYLRRDGDDGLVTPPAEPG